MVLSSAHAPGDLMIVGYRSNSSPTDSISFVTWVELAAGESIILIDSDYTNGGDGTGQTTSGGTWSDPRTITWTNGASSVAPGTVIVIPDVQASTPVANIGTCARSGNFALTNAGEQIFIGQGSFDSSNHFIGQLIFGLDYEGNGGWGDSGESDLPSVLNVALGNINMGEKDDYQVKETARSGKPLAEYKADVLNVSNWEVAVDGVSLSSTAFVAGVTMERLGGVSSGLLFHVRRMNYNSATSKFDPILDGAWSLAQGVGAGDADNLNGPSCVRIPTWATNKPDPTANYYLYFADHSGDYIRMAWSANLEGPWTGFRMSEATYPSLGDRGVLSVGGDGLIDADEGIIIDGHIASPQVIVDDVNQRFIMYYHGQVSFGTQGNSRQQRTVVATSSDGLNFNMPASGNYSSDSRAGQSGHGTLPVAYGESYFRVFEQAGRRYSLSNTGDIYAAPATGDPLVPDASYNHSSAYWDKGPKPFLDETGSRGWIDWGDGFGALRPRHFGVLKRDDILYAFFTNKAATPERIKVSTFDFANLASDYNGWKGTFPNQELIRPDEDWEGVNLPLDISEAGSSDDATHQLRDPGILEDSDGRTYMFYSGSGEKAIGVSQIVSLPQVGGDTLVTTGQDHTYTLATDIDVAAEMLKISHSLPEDVFFDAEGGALAYAGNSYDPVQSSTVGQGSSSYQLAHSGANESVTLTLPEVYYAKPGATLGFSSRMRTSTTGQFAEVQMSFDGLVWQTLWIQAGGSSEGAFSTKSVDISGLEGRTFQLRFRYKHEGLRNSSISTGNGSGRGWFIDEIAATGLEVVTVVSESSFTAASFTLNDIVGDIESVNVVGDDVDDRFLLSVSGLHYGEDIGYGKPYVIRVRASYEQFLYDYFTEAERADIAISGNDADPDKDGVSNFLEHAFGTDPNVSGVNPITFTGSGAQSTITFPWNPDASQSYILQMGDLVTNFVDIAFTESTETVNGVLMVSLTPDSSVAVPGDKAFFRIRVE